MRNRKSTAEWQGTIRTGHGQITTESGALQKIPYSFETRFGDERGTNPEELAGASLAACYSMALAAQLQIQHLNPEKIKTDVQVELSQTDNLWGVSEIRLSTEVQVAGISASALATLAEETKKTCPIGKLFNAHITVNVKLIPSSAPREQGVLDASH